jgi:hypothetical protein
MNLQSGKLLSVKTRLQDVSGNLVPGYHQDARYTNSFSGR